ncbi:hypothetical protein D3C81_1366990 [compost metagenome]
MARLYTAAIAQFYLPQRIAVAGLGQLRVAAQLPAGGAIATQKALVQRMDVQVHGARLQHRASQHLGAQARHQRQRRVAIEQADLGAVGQVLRVGLLEQLLLFKAGHVKAAARLKQWVFAEALWRRFIKCPAGAGQCLDLRRAVGLHEHGCRTPRRVVARLRLAFEQQHLLLASQAIAQGGTGDPGANDQGVVDRGHARSCFGYYHL